MKRKSSVVRATEVLLARPTRELQELMTMYRGMHPAERNELGYERHLLMSLIDIELRRRSDQQ